ncbi:splicing regulatory glutamine/lysine-rich protein 1-like [Macrobrachium rosenbergii]|uniref:splicing regulatory glutamine/lysine-rich protein 1-like n=1 Tax=Macrobrachium rosenbergii TaxID=79674 RepID=UPI0034D49920
MQRKKKAEDGLTSTPQRSGKRCRERGRQRMALQPPHKEVGKDAEKKKKTQDGFTLTPQRSGKRCRERRRQRKGFTLTPQRSGKRCRERRRQRKGFTLTPQRSGKRCRERRRQRMALHPPHKEVGKDAEKKKKTQDGFILTLQRSGKRCRERRRQRMALHPPHKEVGKDAEKEEERGWLYIHPTKKWEKMQRKKNKEDGFTSTPPRSGKRCRERRRKRMALHPPHKEVGKDAEKEEERGWLYIDPTKKWEKMQRKKKKEDGFTSTPQRSGKRCRERRIKRMALHRPHQEVGKDAEKEEERGWLYIHPTKKWEKMQRKKNKEDGFTSTPPRSGKRCRERRRKRMALHPPHKEVGKDAEKEEDREKALH